jgi:hypothetical protein
VVPCGQSILPKLLTFLFTLHILLDRFTHDPVWRTFPRPRESLHSLAHRSIQLDARGSRKCHKE